jgi:acetyltransferase-like isoleucine patch superfamily enzyme
MGQLTFSVWKLVRFKLNVWLLRGRISARPGLGMLGPRSYLRVVRGGRLQLGERPSIGDGAMIWTSATLTVGQRFFLGSNSRIVAYESIEIGDDVSIADMVSILDHDHEYHLEGGHLTIEKDSFVTAPIRIGSNVWLGDKVTVLKGVTISDDVIVAANSVVTKDVPPRVVVAGAPARVIREIT